jgi:predicted esterase
LPRDVEEQAFTAEAIGFYAAFLPPGYSDADKQAARYPLVVILHGVGSTELDHGALANDFGRQGILYVAVRAPYPAADTFLEEGKPGWTAWPNYPAVWGKLEDPTSAEHGLSFAKAERLYTDWIAAALADARKRYRVAPDRAIVVGHSQGGTFAHRFAVDHPDMLRAYVAIAGRHQVVQSDPSDADALRAHGISVLVLHNEADPVVPAQHSKELVQYLKANGVRTDFSIPPGGNHRMNDEFRRRTREFIRRECDSDDRSP